MTDMIDEKKFDEQKFKDILQPKLDKPSWDRALAISKKYGSNLLCDIAIVLFYAINERKVEEVLGALEKQNEPSSDDKAMEELFLYIQRDVLGL